MSMACLTQSTMDIHGGGQDLIFPHHENEIAQSEGATGKPFSRFWVHNGFVTIDQEKMSKSLGNFFTIQEVFEKMPAHLGPAARREILRYFLLSVHYRGPIDFSDQHLAQTKAALDNYYLMLIRFSEVVWEQRTGRPTAHTRRIQAIIKAFPVEFRAAMDDDLNVPGALALFQQLITAANRYVSVEGHAKMLAQIRHLFARFGTDLLGLFAVEPSKWSFQPWSFVTPAAPAVDVAALVKERERARREKDFGRSDQLRRQLAAAGVIIEDLPDGSTRIKR
jgi:cysteinyl-tRNA synthetase